MNVTILNKKLKSLYAPKGSKPLNNILIDCNNFNIMFITTNLDLTTSITVPCEAENFKVLVDYKELINSINSFPKNTEISLTVTDKLLISSKEYGTYSLGLDVLGTFPEIKEMYLENKGYEVTLETIKKMEKILPFTAGKNEMREVLQSIYYDSETDQLIATDGHSMGIIKNIPKMFDVPMVMKNTDIKQLLKMIKNNHSEITSSIMGNYIVFGSEEFRIAFRKIKDIYPPYSKVIPEKWNYTITLDKKAINSIPLKNLNQATHQIFLYNSKGTTIFGFENNNGTDWKTKAGSTNFDENMAFNAPYLIQIAKFIDSDKLKFKVVDASAGVLITHEDKLALLMPILLN